MSKKLEQVLECLINEESDRASELLHDVIVEKARSIYQELVEDEDLAEEDLAEEDKEEEEAKEEACESFEPVVEDDEEKGFGGDMGDDFEDDIEADMDGEEEGEFDAEEEGEEEIEDRVEDLESALADLQSEFDELMGYEEEEHPELADDDMGMEPEMDDMDMEDELPMESLEEATKLQDKVSEPSNVEGADSKEAPYTKAPSKRLDGADPIKIDSSEEAGAKADEGSDHTPSDNIDEEPSASPAQKQSDKADQKDSLLSKEVK